MNINQHPSSGNDDSRVIHRARWIVADPWTILENGYIKTQGYRIVELGQGVPPSGLPVKDHGEGALIPALINAHTHLELCALKGSVSLDQGFIKWVEDLLRERDALDKRQLTAAASDGITELIHTGCAGIGEISTLGITRDICLKSGLAGAWFREILGDNISTIQPEKQKPQHHMNITLAVHGPHTCSPDLIKTVFSSFEDRDRRISIHLSESEEEHTFITTGKGAWADFLNARGIDFSGWGLPDSSPVAYLDRLGILNECTLAVHLLLADNQDLEILKRRKVHICVCPRSNRNLHGHLPDLARMLQIGLTPCLGTDSLASVASLNIFEEMAFVSKKFPQISPAAIFAMATVNGAAALGIDKLWGSLLPGKMFIPVFVPVTARHPQRLMENLVNASKIKSVSETSLVRKIHG
jgi:cytosine/adenosine deaminase-related metal-dependent hydrolase